MFTVDFSVPIWGLFNLTHLDHVLNTLNGAENFSVPIWGLFNLTNRGFYYDMFEEGTMIFPSPSGDYLI